MTDVCIRLSQRCEAFVLWSCLVWTCLTGPPSLFPECMTVLRYICMPGQTGKIWGSAVSILPYIFSCWQGLSCAEDHLFSLYLEVRSFVSGIHCIPWVTLFPLFSLRFCKRQLFEVDAQMLLVQKMEYWNLDFRCPTYYCQCVCKKYWRLFVFWLRHLCYLLLVLPELPFVLIVECYFLKFRMVAGCLCTVRS